MWLVSSVSEAFSYVGWQVASGMNLRSWHMGFLMYASICGWQESGVKLCGQCLHMLYVIGE